MAKRGHYKVILLIVTPRRLFVKALSLRRSLVQIAKKLAVLLADLGVGRAGWLVHRAVLRVAPGLELGIGGCKIEY